MPTSSLGAFPHSCNWLTEVNRKFGSTSVRYLAELGFVWSSSVNLTLTKAPLQNVHEQFKIKKKYIQKSHFTMSEYMAQHILEATSCSVLVADWKQWKYIAFIDWNIAQPDLLYLNLPATRLWVYTHTHSSATKPQKIWSERSAGTQNRKRAVNSPLSMKMLE